MKIVLTNSYSDYNKGDLGILLGTINCLKKVKKDVEINAISSFNKRDDFFETHHTELKKQVTQIYPAIIGRLFNSSKLLMLLELLWDLLRMLVIYFGPFLIFKRILFTKPEQETLKCLQESDIVISKGGSFICNEKGIIGFLRFFREMTILVLAIRMNKKVVIWGQSIGPVYGSLSLKLVNWILKKSKLVVIRENKCIENYPKIIFPDNNTVLGYDLAFSIVDIERIEDKKGTTDTVGITIKRFKDKETDDNYTKTLKEVIEYLVTELNKNVVIVPHVTIDDDIDKSIEVYKTLEDKVKHKVQVFTEDYNGIELLGIYSKFDLLIGTRLHSTIFAMSVKTKVINIAYHGTKASGVFQNFDISDFVIEGDNITTSKLKETIQQLIAISNEDLALGRNVLKAQEVNLEIAKRIIAL